MRATIQLNIIQRRTKALQQMDFGIAPTTENRPAVPSGRNIFIERLWRSVKYEEVSLKAYDSISEARRELGCYFDFYTHRRWHQSLDYRTPEEVYWATLDQMPAAV